ncbi:MAG: hypothetical protein HY078_12955 [Elusimicrobia bacterium]|nr:hypothetical protein [Elusimicrobiota bacterium]
MTRLPLSAAAACLLLTILAAGLFLCFRGARGKEGLGLSGPMSDMTMVESVWSGPQTVAMAPEETGFTVYSMAPDKVREMSLRLRRDPAFRDHPSDGCRNLAWTQAPPDVKGRRLFHEIAARIDADPQEKGSPPYLAGNSREAFIESLLDSSETLYVPFCGEAGYLFSPEKGLFLEFGSRKL